MTFLSFPARGLLFHHPGPPVPRGWALFFTLFLPYVWGRPNRGASEDTSAVISPPQGCPVPSMRSRWSQKIRPVGPPSPPSPQPPSSGRRVADGGESPRKRRRPSPPWAPRPLRAPLGFLSRIPAIWGPPLTRQTPVGHIWFQRKKQGGRRPKGTGSPWHTQ